MPPNAKVSPLRTSTRVSISCLSMASASPFSCFSTWPGVFSLIRSLSRTLPCCSTVGVTSMPSTRLFELHRSGAAFATGNLIGDLASCLMLAGCMWEANKRGLAIISTCCLRSSADSSSSSKRPLILPMLNPARVLASFTDTSLLRVVICPEPGGLPASASRHFTPSSRRLVSLIDTIWAASSTWPTGEIHLLRPGLQRRQVPGIIADQQPISPLVRHQVSPGAEQLSAAFSQLLSVGKVQGHALRLQGQVLQAFLLFGFTLRLICLLPGLSVRVDDRTLLLQRETRAIRYRPQRLAPGNLLQTQESVPLTSGATTRFLWFISARACSTWATGASSITSETGLSLRAAGGHRQRQQQKQQAYPSHHVVSLHVASATLAVHIPKT